MPIFKRRGRSTLAYDWDPDNTVTVHNKTSHNLLLDLPTGHFRLDAGRTFHMTPEILDVPQVKELIDAGQIEITR